MRNLDKALADIVEIRSRIAASTAFHGFGPTALAATAVIALITAAGQSAVIDDPALEPDAYFV